MTTAEAASESLTAPSLARVFEQQLQPADRGMSPFGGPAGETMAQFGGPAGEALLPPPIPQQQPPGFGVVAAMPPPELRRPSQDEAWPAPRRASAGDAWPASVQGHAGAGAGSVASSGGSLASAACRDFWGGVGGGDDDSPTAPNFGSVSALAAPAAAPPQWPAQGPIFEGGPPPAPWEEGSPPRPSAKPRVSAEVATIMHKIRSQAEERVAQPRADTQAGAPMAPPLSPKAGQLCFGGRPSSMQSPQAGHRPLPTLEPPRAPWEPTQLEPRLAHGNEQLA